MSLVSKEEKEERIVIIDKILPILAEIDSFPRLTRGVKPIFSEQLPEYKVQLLEPMRMFGAWTFAVSNEKACVSIGIPSTEKQWKIFLKVQLLMFRSLNA